MHGWWWIWRQAISENNSGFESQKGLLWVEIEYFIVAVAYRDAVRCTRITGQRVDMYFCNIAGKCHVVFSCVFMERRGQFPRFYDEFVEVAVVHLET